MLLRKVFQESQLNRDIWKKINFLKLKFNFRPETLKNTSYPIETRKLIGINNWDYYDSWDYYDFDNLIGKQIESRFIDEEIDKNI